MGNFKNEKNQKDRFMSLELLQEQKLTKQEMEGMS